MAKRTKRGLTNNFMDDLMNDDGVLRPVLDLVKTDDAITLCIRDGYVNLYYRGGSLLRICARARGGYEMGFCWNYMSAKGAAPHYLSPDKQALQAATTVAKPDDLEVWVRQIPLIKTTMDLWFSKHPKLEREFQQTIERVNNCNIHTDYYIVDIEYANSEFTKLRADMLAFHWPRTKEARHVNAQFAPRLTMVELKYGDGAMTGKSGLVGHVTAMADAYRAGRLDFGAVAQEALFVFEQRVRLGLIKCGGKEEQFRKMSRVAEGTPDYLVLAADHDPDSTVLKRELKKIAAMSDLPFNVKVATASPIGFGLFTQNIVDITTALDLF